ncbi:MAG: hypothetical protein NTW38_03985 [Candidatus Aminicenantes bacterium]|nr:hypothetical protein [Candidatus Aminicenantes bacterium]
MKIRRDFVFLVLFAVAMCAAWGDSLAARIKLEELSTIGGPETDALFLWTAISVDPEDNVFFSDALDCSIKKFGPDGVLLKKAGRKGQGPGEFEKPAGVAVIGDQVYAWDLFGRALQVFDRNLVYRETLLMPGTVDGLAGFPGGRVAACIRPSYTQAKVVVFSPDGTPVREFALSDPKDPTLFGTVSFAVDPSGESYFGYLFRDLVEKRSAAGERIWARTAIGAGPSAVNDVQGFKVPSETCILSLARDGQGRVFILGGTKAVHQGRDVFVFRPDGSVLASLVLPEPSHTLYFDHRDRLYVSADGGVTMKKYRVTFE